MQIGYLEKVDSDQVGAVMGFLDLMLYPVNDCVIRTLDWAAGTVTAISKKHVLKTLNVSESMFIDGLLMTGTSFLPQFPGLLGESSSVKGPRSIADALNILRTSEKSMAVACTTFHDVLEKKDPKWEEKYRKARMAVDHFIYYSEAGEVKVWDSEHLTKDNHQYLGLQLPAELFHYLNTGLISPRILTWITHAQLQVLPTLDGFASAEYKTLVTTHLARVKEAAMSILVRRLHRGIEYSKVMMKVWYNPDYLEPVFDRHGPRALNFTDQIAGWTIQSAAVAKFFPQFVHGSIASEIFALQKPDFAATTRKDPKDKKPKAVESAGLIKSICLWRFLHVRGYIDDSHGLTQWGTALAAAMAAFKDTVEHNPSVANLFEAVLMAFELIRFDILNSRYKHGELNGLPMHGDEDDQASLILISRCATLLKLRHEEAGYTGPLSKNLLHFRSLVSEARSSDRDLLEAILASMFLFAQAERKRDDSLELSHS